jgi:hypothetical protein
MIKPKNSPYVMGWPCSISEMDFLHNCYRKRYDKSKFGRPKRKWNKGMKLWRDSAGYGLGQMLTCFEHGNCHSPFHEIPEDSLPAMQLSTLEGFRTIIFVAFVCSHWVKPRTTLSSIHSFIDQWLYSPLLGPRPFYSFVIFFTQTVGLLGRGISPSQPCPV